MNKVLEYIINNPLVTGDSSLAQLFRTYMVGAVNLVFGLILNYICLLYTSDAADE